MSNHLAGQAHDVDRTGWPKGPWDDEPDRVDWKTEAGYPAILLRQRRGNWCGYVGVPLEHPSRADGFDADSLNVHGSITYGGACAGVICHVPEPGEPDEVYWLGFDCGHDRDAAPGEHHYEPERVRWRHEADGAVCYWRPPRQRRETPRGFILQGERPFERHGVYRTAVYARAECERLAAQLRALERCEGTGDTKAAAP